MDVLLNIPALIKLATVFTLIIFLTKWRLSLGSALMTGSIILGLWCALSPYQIGTSILRSLLAERTIALCLVVSLILILSYSMEKTGQMRRLLESSKGVIQNVHLSLALFPALIGLLPMPGGAIFSAPMVEATGNKHSLSAEQKTLVNYWYRHICEYSWPLYPSVLLTCALSGISLWTFVIVQFPLTLFAALIGYLMILRPVPIPKEQVYEYPKGALRGFLTELMPILIVVGGAVLVFINIHLLKGYWPYLRQFPQQTPLIIALLFSILWMWRKNHVKFSIAQAIFKNKFLGSMIFMIAGVMIFRGILMETPIIIETSQTLIASHIPIILIVMFLPFFVGLILGITTVFVATTFPIIFPLLESTGLQGEIFPYTILAFCSGYVGHLMSPLHFCLVLTCTYFKANLSRIYKKLWLPCSFVATAGIISFLVIHSFDR